MAEPAVIVAPAQSHDGPVGRNIIDLHVWAVGEGLRGVDAGPLFDEFCRRLVSAGMPLWRAFAGMRTLHPQWGGYGYTWRREPGAIEARQFRRGDRYQEAILNSPIGHLIRLGEEVAASTPASELKPWVYLRRRLCGPGAQLDLPLLDELAAEGATDYFAEVIRFGGVGDASRGTGIAWSFATDRSDGFAEDDLALLRAVLPVVSLAMMAHAGHRIASSLLGAYLGADAGRRVHTGAIERGSVESLRAVLWYADVRAFTALADASPGTAVVDLLDEVFEALTAALRPCGARCSNSSATACWQRLRLMT